MGDMPEVLILILCQMATVVAREVVLLFYLIVLPGVVGSAVSSHFACSQCMVDSIFAVF